MNIGNHNKRLGDPSPFQKYAPPRLLPVEIAPWELNKWHVQPAFLGFKKQITVKLRRSWMDGFFLLILRFGGYIVVLFLGGHFANLFLVWKEFTPHSVGED